MAKVEFNLEAFEQIRRMDGTEEALQDFVDEVLEQVQGHGHFEGGVDYGRTRSRGFVVTADFEAILAEHQDLVLTRALYSGRGG